jgi:hypothetical protein
VNLAWPKTLTYPKHWARDPVTAMIAGEATKTIGRVVSLIFFFKKIKHEASSSSVGGDQ